MLLKIAPNDLLRRLPIIIVEDTYGLYGQLHDHYATLLFTMVTGKLVPNHFDFLTDLAAFLCQSGYHPYSTLTNRPIWNDLSHVNNLHLLSYYGGMKCDIEMLYWTIKDQSQLQYSYKPWSYVTLTSPNIVDLKQYADKVVTILPSAIDFHVCRSIPHSGSDC